MVSLGADVGLMIRQISSVTTALGRESVINSWF